MARMPAARDGAGSAAAARGAGWKVGLARAGGGRSGRSGRCGRMTAAHRRAIRPWRGGQVAAVRGGDHVVAPGVGRPRGQ
ncbi:hypothetical protein BC2230_30366 [Burkholderia cepacia]